MAVLMHSLADPGLWRSSVLRAESSTPPPPPAAPPGASFGGPPPACETPSKSKVTAGLLGLLSIFGIPGVHRIYLGYTAIGAVQLVAGPGLWLLIVLGSLLTLGLSCFCIPLPALASLWGLVEAILILAGQPPFDRDAYGRPLAQ